MKKFPTPDEVVKLNKGKVQEAVQFVLERIKEVLVENYHGENAYQEVRVGPIKYTADQASVNSGVLRELREAGWVAKAHNGEGATTYTVRAKMKASEA